ncbi:transposase [Streptomyces sp. NPDC096324]|uniref:transposase n=1 Tax=Streptomyces sp. NPDC096324 TaxID=3366085 RepID=UPI0037FEE267
MSLSPCSGQLCFRSLRGTDGKGVTVSSGPGAAHAGPGRPLLLSPRNLDCLGLVVAVTAASVQDRDAAVPLLEWLRKTYFSIRLVWADGGYAGRLVDWAAEKHAGFVVLPRR